MKILHIITGLGDGGAEKFVIDLSNELSKNNEVILCSLFDIKKDMFLTESLSKKIKVVSLNKKLGFDFKILLSVYSLIKKEKPDVVNTHLRALFYSSLSILFSKTNFFHTVHNMADKETTYFFRNIYKIFFKYFNVTPIAIAKKVLESIQKEYSDSFNVLIENGVKELDISSNITSVQNEIKNYKITENTKILLSIGRIGEQKNFSLLVKTANKLVMEGFDITLLIIGRDHGELSFLESIACDRVHFLGTKKNVIDYIANADAFCMSSIYEGMPIVLLESLSMGCIPICTPAGGIVDIIDKNIGFISNGFSELDYYNVMKLFMHSNDVAIKEMKYNCKQLFTNRYNITTTAENYFNLYQTAINN